MKIRNGFVSNSSSSSFIILYNNGASVKFKDFEWSVDDLLDYVENISHDWSSECTQLKAVGKDLTIEFIKDRWCDSEYNQKLVDIITKSKKDSAAVLNISYHDPITMKLFNLLKGRNKITVIDEGD